MKVLEAGAACQLPASFCVRFPLKFRNWGSPVLRPERTETGASNPWQSTPAGVPLPHRQLNPQRLRRSQKRRQRLGTRTPGHPQ